MICLKETDYNQNLQTATSILGREIEDILDTYYEKKMWIKKEGLLFFFDYILILFQKILHRVDQENSPGLKRTITYEQFMKTMRGLGIIVDG